jgi:hypothetical protein
MGIFEFIKRAERLLEKDVESNYAKYKEKKQKWQKENPEKFNLTKNIIFWGFKSS